MPKDNYKNGSNDLLQLLDEISLTYKNWTEEYYEEEFEEREPKLKLIKSNYSGTIIIKELVQKK